MDASASRMALTNKAARTANRHLSAHRSVTLSFQAMKSVPLFVSALRLCACETHAWSHHPFSAHGKPFKSNSVWRSPQGSAKLTASSILLKRRNKRRPDASRIVTWVCLSKLVILICFFIRQGVMFVRCESAEPKQPHTHSLSGSMMVP